MHTGILVLVLVSTVQVRIGGKLCSPAMQAHQADSTSFHAPSSLRLCLLLSPFLAKTDSMRHSGCTSYSYPPSTGLVRVRDTEGRERSHDRDPPVDRLVGLGRDPGSKKGDPQDPGPLSAPTPTPTPTDTNTNTKGIPTSQTRRSTEHEG